MKNINDYPTDEQLAEYLNRQIDSELEKPFDQQDMEYIDECNAFLIELNLPKALPDPTVKAEKLKELYAEFAKMHRPHVFNPVSFLKWFAAAAFIIIIIFTIPVLIVAAMNGMTPVDMLEKWGKDIFNLPYDEPVEAEGMTFIRNGNVVAYDSIDDLLKAEQLDILCPTWLPDGIKINSIVAVDEKNGLTINFVFNKNEIYYTVMLYDEFTELIKNSSTEDVTDISGLTVYFTQIENKDYALFVNDGYSYSASAHDKDILIKILESIKAL